MTGSAESPTAVIKIFQLYTGRFVFSHLHFLGIILYSESSTNLSFSKFFFLPSAMGSRENPW